MSKWVLTSYNTKDEEFKTYIHNKYETAYDKMGEMFQNIFVESEGNVKGGYLRPFVAFVKDGENYEYEFKIYKIKG